MADDQRNALDRITKLIRLATNNPNEEEARSAALHACRLMEAHRVTLSMRGKPVSQDCPPAARYGQSSNSQAEASTWQQTYAEYARRAQEFNGRVRESGKARGFDPTAHYREHPADFIEDFFGDVGWGKPGSR